MKTFKIALLLLVAPMYSNAASTPEDCTAITNDKYRLKCYDKFFAEKDYVYQQRERTEHAEVQTPKPTESSEQNFGLENKVNRTSDSINSEIVGNFTKWQKGLEFTLTNGQVWKVVGSTTLYYPVKNAPITIEKGVFGSFYLSFKDLNKRLKVKRIK